MQRMPFSSLENGAFVIDFGHHLQDNCSIASNREWKSCARPVVARCASYFGNER